MLLLIATLATVLDILFVLIKFRLKRYADGTLDAILLLAVFMILKGSELILLVGIFSSLVISIYLWFYPPKLNRLFK
jgi:hypothetical protein